MEKTILITGKEIPLGEALGEAARKTGRNLVITYEGIKTSKEDTTKIKKYPSGKTVETLWNRGSNAGARTVLVEAERLFHKIDETLLVFDADYYSQVFRDLTSTGCAKIIDNLIAGFIYLTWELTKRYAVQNAGTLVFILKAKKTATETFPFPQHWEPLKSWQKKPGKFPGKKTGMYTCSESRMSFLKTVAINCSSSSTPQKTNLTLNGTEFHPRKNSFSKSFPGKLWQNFL